MQEISYGEFFAKTWKENYSAFSVISAIDFYS